MNQEVLIFSDLHCHCHKRSNDRLEDCLKALNWVFDVAEENNITNILFGGDLYHDRQKIEVYTYQRTFETLAKRLYSKKFNLYLLLGNHDLWFNDKTTISSVVPLSSLPGVKIIAQPERIDIAGCYWDFIPFTHNPIETLSVLKEKEGKQQYALGHIAVDGAVLHGTHHADVSIEHDGDMVSISPSLFNNYDMTFLGHYHAEQKMNDSLEYIGSPLQLSFGEAFQEKHLIIFNGITKEKRYVINDFSPKHLIISLKDKDKYSLEGNFVRIKVDELGATDLIAMKKELLESNNLGSLEIKQQKKKIQEHVIIDAKSILFQGDEMLSKYVEEVGCLNLEKDKLVSIGKKIRQKVE